MRIAQFLASLFGISPLLTNRMRDETVRGLITGNHPAVDKSLPFRDMAAMGLYAHPDNPDQLVVYRDHLYGMLKGAGRGVKLGKKQISTAKSTILFSLMSIEEPYIPLLKADGTPMTGDDWKVQTDRGVGQKGDAVGIVRARFDEWRLDFTVKIDLDRCNSTKVRELLEIGASDCGLLAFRPSKNGPYGRSIVKKFEWIGGEEERPSTESEKKPSKAKTTKNRLKDIAATSDNGELEQEEALA